MIRPEALALLARWREVMLALCLAGFGLWTATRGGPILLTIGLALIALAAGWGLSALRRMRFAQTIAAPGVVEVIEGEVRYFGPNLGGSISLSDLVELRLMTLRGRRVWRLKQRDGQLLLIPVDATGAEALYDGFTTLPGLDMAALLSALTPTAAAHGSTLRLADRPDMVLIWHRKGKGLVA
ncbi:hypothetical protein [Tabrizicola sp.]|uniref:hypothetical protein n=1 Tax=Tabrizicola sp. TaxID=2005166 RepID=UPI003D26C1D7